MNINTPPSYQRLPAKANNGSRPTSKSLYIVLAIAIGAVGLLAFDTQQANYLKNSLRKGTAAAAGSDNINIGLVSSVVDEKKNDILSLRTPEEVDGAAVGSEEDDGEEPLLSAEVDTSVGETLPSDNDSDVSKAKDRSIEQKSRAFPIWNDKRLSNDSSITRPYGWCVPEDIAKENKDTPKGLFFVKVHKSGSSTGAGVTLRIRDNLSRRLNHLDEKNAPANNCFAHVEHATASELQLEKRDQSQSFMWSIVREPAQRTLSHYFYFRISHQNHTATEDDILKVLKTKHQNYQSKYLDLPRSQNNKLSSSTDRIINEYDFLAVNERMEESLVVLAMLAQIPLTDVVVLNSKLAGAFDGGNGKRCVKLKKKWTTPKIDKYILSDYRKANKHDYQLYDAAQRSLDRTIDSFGRKRVEENVEVLRRLQQQNDEGCASEVTMPCPEPENESKKQEHMRLVKESCYFSDIGCGHACTDLVLADHGDEEWKSITSSQDQG